MSRLQSLTFFQLGTWQEAEQDPPHDDDLRRRLDALGGLTRALLDSSAQDGDQMSVDVWRARPVIGVMRDIGSSDGWTTRSVWSKSDLQTPHLYLSVPSEAIHERDDPHAWFEIAAESLERLLLAMPSHSARQAANHADGLRRLAVRRGYTMAFRREWPRHGAKVETATDVLGRTQISLRGIDASESTLMELSSLKIRDLALLHPVEIKRTLKRAAFDEKENSFELWLPYYSPALEWIRLDVDSRTGLVVK